MTVKKSKPISVSNRRLAEQKLEITGVFFICLAVLAAAAVFFNSAGFVGELIKQCLVFLFGKGGAFLPIILLAFIGGMLIGAKRIDFLNRRFISLGILFLVTLAVVHIFSGADSQGEYWEIASAGGGFVGYFMVKWLHTWFGNFGTVVFLAALFTVSFILALDQPFLVTISCFFRRKPETDVTEQAEQEAAATSFSRQPDLKTVPGVRDVKDQPQSEETPEANNKVVSLLQTLINEKEKPTKVKKPLPKSKETPDQEKVEKYQPKVITSDGTYCLPSPDLVGVKSKTRKNAPEANQSQQLEETLAYFGVKAKVIEVHQGPVITRYDLQPAPGVKVSRIVNLTDDLALALAAKGLRLEAPIPGKAAIGIEVPNKETQVVSFRDMLDAKVFWTSSKLSVALGMDIGGEVAMADLGKMPHLLIAGATGSGKSVCINTLIMSILYKAFPNEVKFIMIDPKMVELSMYNGIPHLMAPVVTAAKKAAGVLKLVVDEMERRYKLFAEARVRDLEKYNSQLKEEEPLPYIVVIIDELADLMMVSPVEVEDYICRIAQMARATGIHLVVATQRPSVDVITGLIKANIPSRIAFAVSSQIDSRTILDAVGAERLLGRGDMLFSPVGAMKPRRMQGALVNEKEIEAVIQHWKEQGEPEYQEKFINIPERAEQLLDENQDDLFWDAVQIGVDNGHVSASLLQRRLRVGYTRAARLVDMMEAKGIVGSYDGSSKPREVYITARQMEELKNKIPN